MFRRYACVRQADQSDCGAAALATICQHYRRPLGLQQMRELAGTDRVGTNLLGMVQAAEKLGFSARAVKGTNEALPAAPLPGDRACANPRGVGALCRPAKGDAVRSRRGRPRPRPGEAEPRGVLQVVDRLPVA